jgi:hypothetical protein
MPEEEKKGYSDYSVESVFEKADEGRAQASKNWTSGRGVA